MQCSKVNLLILWNLLSNVLNILKSFNNNVISSYFMNNRYDIRTFTDICLAKIDIQQIL